MHSLALVAALGAPSLVAQESFDVAASVECFARKAADTTASCDPGVLSAIVYITPGASYPRSTVEAVLDGLVELALTSTDQNVRVGTVSTIAMAGNERYEGSISTLPWLRRLYTQSQQADIKGTAISGAYYQADKVAVAEFYGMVATDEDAGPYDMSLPALALLKLTGLGEPGRAVLQQLAAEDEVVNPQARMQLHELERNNWKTKSNPDQTR
jgi:hypothetical protein